MPSRYIFVPIVPFVTRWIEQLRQDARYAVGARRVEVVRLVIRQGMGIALAGITLAVAGALALTRVMSSLLYDVPPRDPQTFVTVTSALAATALVACCVPAFKAAHVDPATALRHESRRGRRRHQGGVSR